MGYFRTAYDGLQDAVSRETWLSCDIEKSRTVQDEAQACDLNFIVKQFGVTKQFPQGHVDAPIGVFVDVFDFKTAMDAVIQSRNAFEAMPSAVRKRFGNDPGEFVKFCEDPANVADIVKLGLAVRVDSDSISSKPTDGPLGTGSKSNESSSSGRAVGKGESSSAGSDSGSG